MKTSVTDTLDKFFAQFPSREYKKGDILIQAGVEPSSVFYIESGVIRNYWISPEGTEMTLNMYKPHAFLPMSWAIAGVPNTHFYDAITATTVKLAPKKDVLEFLMTQPDIMFDLLRRIYIGMEGLWGHMKSLTTGNSYIKLAATLVILGKRFGKQEHDTIVIQLKMSERDLANYAGMSRETASREIQKLKKEQLVSFEKGKLTILAMTALETLIPNK